MGLDSEPNRIATLLRGRMPSAMLYLVEGRTSNAMSATGTGLATCKPHAKPIGTLPATSNFCAKTAALDAVPMAIANAVWRRAAESSPSGKAGSTIPDVRCRVLKHMAIDVASLVSISMASAGAWSLSIGTLLDVRFAVAFGMASCVLAALLFAMRLAVLFDVRFGKEPRHPLPESQL